MELIQDKRVLQHTKKKTISKKGQNGLPELKFSPAVVRKMNENFMMSDSSRAPSYQPLSNILISKKIYPTNPELEGRHHLLANQADPNLSIKRLLESHQLVIQDRIATSLSQRARACDCQQYKHLKAHLKIVKGRKYDRTLRKDVRPNSDAEQVNLIEQNLSKKHAQDKTTKFQIQLQDFDKEISRVHRQERKAVPTFTDMLTKSQAAEQLATFQTVGSNNNQELVRKILVARGVWRAARQGEAAPNLKWAFSKQRLNFKKMWSFGQVRIANHFEFNQQICKKDLLIRNLQIYCETRKMQIFTLTPVTFIIDFDDQYCEYNLKQFLSFFAKNDPRKPAHKSIPLAVRFQPYMTWQNSDVKKKVNILSRPVNCNTYYSENSYLWLLKPTGLNRGRGIEIFNTLEQLYDKLQEYLALVDRRKIREKLIVDPSVKYSLSLAPDKLSLQPSNEKNQENDKSQQVADNKQLVADKGTSATEKLQSLTNTVQQVADGRQGHSQPLCHETTDKEQREKQADSFEEYQYSYKKKNQSRENMKKDQAKREKHPSRFNQYQTEGRFQSFKLDSCSFVIQKYVQKPYLIANRKFDIRVWALLTDQLKLYFFCEGYIRTSAEAYCTDDISNYFIHLTNNAVQKHSLRYGEFQNGNQLPFRQLCQYMTEQQVQTVWARIKEITFMVFSSVKKKLNPHLRKHCFELFGLDFIIDREVRVWLIEVNENPCIECASPLLSQLIPRMLNDAFKIVLDPLIDRKVDQVPYPVVGYPDNVNLWELLAHLTPNGQYLHKGPL